MSPASPRRRAVALMVLVLASALPGCAWQNPDNRRTWNAFEENWVPETEPAFSFALPLIVPGGLLAILVDVLVVHPFSVIDDAWARSVKSWDDLDWQGDYWLEAGVAPFRDLGTGALFVVGLVGRSLFDIPAFRADDPDGEPLAKVNQGPGPSSPEPAPDSAEVISERTVLSAWLQTLLLGDSGPGPLRVSRQVLQVAWNDELQQLAELARQLLVRDH